jgi:hypothetical protein
MLRERERESRTHTSQCEKRVRRRRENLSRFSGSELVILKPVIGGSNVIGFAPNLEIPSSIL